MTEASWYLYRVVTYPTAEVRILLYANTDSITFRTFTWDDPSFPHVARRMRAPGE